MFNPYHWSKLLRPLCKVMSSRTPNAFCLPQNTCLVPVRPQVVCKKKWLCRAQGRSGLSGLVEHKGRKRPASSRKAYSTYKSSTSFGLKYFNFSLTLKSQVWWKPYTITRPMPGSLLYKARRWVTGAPKAASKSLLVARWSQTLQEGVGGPSPLSPTCDQDSPTPTGEKASTALPRDSNTTQKRGRHKVCGS